MKTMKTLIPALALVLAAGCLKAPPAQLLSARQAYNRSATGPAAVLAPAEVEIARQAIDQADWKFQNRGDTREVRDYAYIAQRKAELAEAKARTEIEQARLIEAQAQAALLLEEQARSARAERDRLRMEQTTVSTTTTTTTEDEASTVDASKSKAEQPKGSIKEDERGTVVTTFFKVGDSSLETYSKELLDQAVGKVGDHKVTIGGHTDDTGSEELNEKLSLTRAATARDYLVSKGVPADQITVRGFGESEPVAPNTSAENRAMNRRVEVIIAPSAAVSSR